MISGRSKHIRGIQILRGIAVHQNGANVETAIYAKASGGIGEVTNGVYIDEPSVTGIFSDVERVSDATACELSGLVNPANATVNLSKVTSRAPLLSELTQGKYEQVTPDSTGKWSADAPPNYDGLVAAWIEVPLETVNDASAYNSHIEAKQEAPVIPDGTVLSFRNENVPLGGNGQPYEVCYSYTCPEDVVQIDLYCITQKDICPSCGGAGHLYPGDPKLCDVCGGTGYTGDDGSEICEACGGTGYAASAEVEICDACGGTGYQETEELVSSDVVHGGSGYVSIEITPQGLYTNEYNCVEFIWRCVTAEPNGTLNISDASINGTCLSGDTLITLADGTERRLDALTGDELVLGGDLRPARILRLARGIWSDRHTLYHFDGGTVIDETHEHRFFNADQGFWQKLRLWRIGDHAKRLDGGTPALVSVEPVEERAEMFGLWVERGSYWANGLLSGDASANRPLLADATAEQAADMAASLAEQDLMRILGGVML